MPSVKTVNMPGFKAACSVLLPYIVNLSTYIRVPIKYDVLKLVAAMLCTKFLNLRKLTYVTTTNSELLGLGLQKAYTYSLYIQTAASKVIYAPKSWHHFDRITIVVPLPTGLALLLLHLDDRVGLFLFISPHSQMKKVCYVGLY